MQEKILDVLKRNGPLKTIEIALQVGKNKAKDIQKILNKLLKRNIIAKAKVNKRLQWSLVEPDNSNDHEEL